MILDEVASGADAGCGKSVTHPEGSVAGIPQQRNQASPHHNPMDTESYLKLCGSVLSPSTGRPDGSSPAAITIPPPPPRSEIDNLIGHLLHNDIWRVAFDATTGRPYYYCTMDGSTTWDLALLIRTLRSIEMLSSQAASPEHFTHRHSGIAQAPNEVLLNATGERVQSDAISPIPNRASPPVAPLMSSSTSQSQRIADAKRRKQLVGSSPQPYREQLSMSARRSTFRPSTEHLTQKFDDVEQQMKHFDNVKEARRSAEATSSQERQSKSPQVTEQPIPNSATDTTVEAQEPSIPEALPRKPQQRSPGAGSSWLVTEVESIKIASPVPDAHVPFAHFATRRRRAENNDVSRAPSAPASRAIPANEATRPVLNSRAPPQPFSPSLSTSVLFPVGRSTCSSTASFNREARRLGIPPSGSRCPSPVSGSPHGLQRTWKDELLKREEELVAKRNRLRREKDEHRRRAQVQQARYHFSAAPFMETSSSGFL